METSKQFNNNNNNNNMINKNQQRSPRNRSLLKHRRNIHKNKRQSSLSISKTTTSIVCVVLSLLQAPAGSHALIQSRTRPDMITRSHAGVSKTSLQYLNYRLNDDEGNTQPKASSGIADQQQQAQQQQQQQLQPQQPQQHQISGLFHTLWTAGKTKRAQQLHAKQVEKEQKEQEEQYIIDAYLESIDRRYKRLHETDNDTQSSKKNTGGGFTNALQWLTHGSESWTDAEEQRKQEDGIYMLGLAGLASERLLQRHHLPIPKSKVNRSMLIDLGIKKESIAFLTQPSTSKVSVSEATTIDTSISLGKATRVLQMLQSFQMRSLCKQIAMTYKKTNGLALNAVRLSGKALAHTLCALGAILSNTSGSKHSFQIASAMAATVFTVSLSAIRPLTKA